MQLRRRRDFPELSYANANQPLLKRWFVRSVEGLSGRDRYAALYDIWRREIAPTGQRIFGRMLDLIDVQLASEEQWPPENFPQTPVVIVANHPFGIGDGIAVLALAEQLGRPVRVLISADLLKIPEMKGYSLPINFDETKEAQKANLAVRHEAMRLLKEGVTIVVFPAGGVATAPRGFGKAEDLPWKQFPAKLVRDGGALVIPMHFSGQNGRLFHLASRFSMTVRTSLLIYEFTRLAGRSIHVRIGKPISPTEIAAVGDRKQLTAYLQKAVLALDTKLPESLQGMRPAGWSRLKVRKSRRLAA